MKQKYFKKKRGNSNNENTNFAVKILNDFWEEQSTALDFNKVLQQASNDLLCKFYMGVRKMVNFTSWAPCEVSVSPFNDIFWKLQELVEEFVEANTVFENVLELVKYLGQEKQITMQKLKLKIWENFDINDPTGSQ